MTSYINIIIQPSDLKSTVAVIKASYKIAFKIFLVPTGHLLIRK